MHPIIITISIVIIIFLLLRYYYIKKRGIALLKIVIKSNDSKTFKIDFEPMRNDIKQIEYVRLVLHYAAKVSYLISGTKQLDIGQHPQGYINNIYSTFKLLSSSTNYLDDLDQLNYVKLTENISSLNHEEIRCTFYYVNIQTRHMTTMFSNIPGNSFYSRSTTALLKFVSAKLDEQHIEYLQSSLKKYCELMEYDNLDMSSLKSLRETSNLAFLLRDT